MSSESSSSLDDQEGIGLISAMEARSEHQIVKRFNLLCNITSLLGLVECVLVITWIFKFKNGFSWINPADRFNWHPVLMIIGFIYVYSQSMLIYRRVRFLNKRLLKLYHAGLHFGAMIFIVIALVAVFDSHNYAVPPTPNLYSLHSWMGLLTVILFFSQFLFGFVTFLYPGLSQPSRALLLPLHTKFGSAMFLFAIVTATMGFLEKAIFSITTYSLLPAEGIMINFMGVLLIMFGALVLYLVNEDSYKRLALAEDEMVLTNQRD